MRGLTDLGVDDVHMDREQSARLDRRDDRIHHFFTGRASSRVHGLLHHVGAPIVFALEGACVERGLVVVVGPDVVHLAATGDHQLVEIRRRAPDMGVGRAAYSLPGVRRDGRIRRLRDRYCR